MGKLRRKAKSPASGSIYKVMALPREKARWVWMGLAGPAVAEVRTFWTRLRGIRYCGILLMAKLSIEELTSSSMSVMRVVKSCVWAKTFCTTENSLLMDFIVWFRRVLWVFRIVIVPFRDFPKVCRACLWNRSYCHISGILTWISPTCRLTVVRLTALAVFMPMLNRVPTAAAALSRAPKII